MNLTNISLLYLKNFNLYKLFNIFNLIKLNINRPLHRLPFIMSETNRDSNDTLVLTQRLAKAEKKLKLLTCEINDIKRQISLVSQRSNSSNATLTTLNATSSIRRLHSDAPDSSTNSNNDNPKRTRYDFVKEGDYVVVYTDGACENNGRANAKAGIGIWFGNNHPLNVSEPVKGRATNNTAEIQACMHAVSIAHRNGVNKLKIKTDSQFVINSMTQWIHRWKKNNWKVASGGDVKNKEDFVVLDKACNLLEKIVWEHVDAHKGIDGNEQADRLARSGALHYTSSN